MSLSGSSSSTWNEMVNASKNKKIKIQFPKFKKKCVTNWKLLIFHLNLLFKLKRKSRFAFCLQLCFFALGSRLHQPLPQTCWHEVIVTTNHPLEVKQPHPRQHPPKHKNGTWKIRPWALKKKQKTYRNHVFHQVSWTCQFWGRKTVQKTHVSQRPCLSCISCRSALFFGGFLGLSPNEIFPGWSTGPGKYLLGVYRRLSNP